MFPPKPHASGLHALSLYCLTFLRMIFGVKAQDPPFGMSLCGLTSSTCLHVLTVAGSASRSIDHDTAGIAIPIRYYSNTPTLVTCSKADISGNHLHCNLVHRMSMAEGIAFIHCQNGY